MQPPSQYGRGNALQSLSHFSLYSRREKEREKEGATERSIERAIKRPVERARTRAIRRVMKRVRESAETVKRENH